MAEKLKHMFFSTPIIENYAYSIKKSFPDFDEERFLKSIFIPDWEEKELKQKLRHFTECVYDHLPKEYPDALKILLEISPHFRGFEALVFPDYVECYGQDYPELSMPALKEFTKCCSSEFGVRPFLDNDPEFAMKFFHDWADDDNEHVRRLASEGCRPRLPWGMALKKFKKNPQPILPVLEKLKNDESEYVRRSVANNLNDISKDNPEVTLDICEKWFGKTENTDKLVKHACRDLLKSGNKRALILFGFGDPEEIDVADLQFDQNKIIIGEEIRFSFNMNVRSAAKQKIRLEYIVEYVKAKGKTSQKVFQIREAEFKPGSHAVSRKQTFQDMTTRKHYPGTHTIIIRVNGEEKSSKSFELIQ